MKDQKGFSLIELLIAIIIITVLVSVLVSIQQGGNRTNNQYAAILAIQEVASDCVKQEEFCSLNGKPAVNKGYRISLERTGPSFVVKAEPETAEGFFRTGDFSYTITNALADDYQMLKKEGGRAATSIMEEKTSLYAFQN